MDSKLAPQAEARETAEESEVPVSNPQEKKDGKPSSYSMMEPKMRRIYGEFYREIYFSEKKQLDTKTQELISIAASLVAKCQGCIEGHLKKAIQAGAAPQTSTTQATPSSGVEYGSLQSPSLGKELKFAVQFPPSYERDTNRRYPVLYFLHGMFGNEREFERRGVAAAINKMREDGKIGEFVIVSPAGENSFYLNA